MFERVKFDDAAEIACKMKCTDKQPGEADTPEPSLPEVVEQAEVAASEPVFPDGKWWLDWDESVGNSGTVITFTNGTEFTLEGSLAEAWGVEAGKVSGSASADPKTITLNWKATAEDGTAPEPMELTFIAKNDDLYEAEENQIGNSKPILMHTMSKAAKEILEADGLEFAMSKDAGEDIKEGDGEKILAIRAEKEKGEAQEKAQAEKDAERGVPEVPQPQDFSKVDMSSMFGAKNGEEGKESADGATVTANNGEEGNQP